MVSGRTSQVDTTVPAASLGARFTVRGRYNQFDVRASDFALSDYVFTGAVNPEDITGGRRTPVWASKIPNHRGLTLTSGISVELDDEELVVARTGTRLSMKIQFKDCAQGGICQMEPERGDGTGTPSPHQAAPCSRSTSTTPGSAPASAGSSARRAPAS